MTARRLTPSLLRMGALAALCLAIIAGAARFIRTRPLTPADQARSAIEAPKIDAVQPGRDAAAAASEQSAGRVASAGKPSLPAAETTGPTEGAALRTGAAATASPLVAGSGSSSSPAVVAPRVGTSTITGAEELSAASTALATHRGQVTDTGRAPIVTAADLAALAPAERAAEDVTDATADSPQIMEETLLAAKRATDPSSPKIVARNAMDRLIGAFVAERDEDLKVDLLATAQELTTSSGEPMNRLIALALQPQQPEDVRHQALYLAAEHDTPLVEKIAADRSHPLQLEAQAFLREKRIAAGIATPARDTVRKR